eukprot:symbB.v1.2.010605.t1/scaffold686.1/size316167/24
MSRLQLMRSSETVRRAVEGCKRMKQCTWHQRWRVVHCLEMRWNEHSHCMGSELVGMQQDEKEMISRMESFRAECDQRMKQEKENMAKMTQELHDKAHEQVAREQQAAERRMAEIRAHTEEQLRREREVSDSASEYGCRMVHRKINIASSEERLPRLPQPDNAAHTFAAVFAADMHWKASADTHIEPRPRLLTHTLSEHRPASNWSLLTLCEDGDLGVAEEELDHEISEMETIATSDEETPQGSEFENDKQTGVLMVSI